MKSILCASLLIVLMPSAYAAQLPGDSADGSFLHDVNCRGCHDTGIYTRKERRIRSLDALKGQLPTAVIWQTNNSPRLRCRTSSST